MSAPKEAIPWPPQTTQDVLNLTPRKNRHRTPAYGAEPTSPSPLRKTTGPSRLDDAASDESTDVDDVAGSDMDDEETLKLELARIEAKLRLKQLQKKKAAQKEKVRSTTTSLNESRPPEKRPPPPEPPQQERQATIQVPASPSSRSFVARATAPGSPKSPSRVLLGIDKGLTGRDISLGRPKTYRSGNRHSAVTTARASTRPASPPRPAKSFSQRLIESRQIEKTKAERAAVVASSRSTGFGIHQPPTSVGFSPTLSAAAQAAQKATQNFSAALASFDRASISNPDPFVSSKPESLDESGFDSFSGLHLSKRTTPHPTVSRHLAKKHILLLPDLLKTIISPTFDPPDVEGDWITLGIIATKSEPRTVGQNTGASNPAGKKYMVLTLTDLKWELELFLFGTGFDRFWTLPVGTLVAILNPGIMKPRNPDGGKFSLTLSDDHADNILEIGVARDLAFCKSVKRDGKPCGTWIDRRHTSVCAFHVEQAVSKTRVTRPEVNSMSKLFSPPSKKGFGRTQATGARKFLSRGSAREQTGLLSEGPINDLPTRLGGAGGSVYVAPGRSTAQLIDLDSDPHLRGSKEDRLRKRIADGKKERDLTRRLIEAQGKEGGMGTQYLKTRMGMTGEERARDEERRKREEEGQGDVRGVLEGLKRRREAGSEVRLSPVKRKRAESVLSTSRPGSGGMLRPGSSMSRPGSGMSRPGSGMSRPGSGMSRPGSGGMGAGGKPLVSALSKKSVSFSGGVEGWSGGGYIEKGGRTWGVGNSGRNSAAGSFTEGHVAKKTRFAVPDSSDDDDGLDIVMG